MNFIKFKTCPKCRIIKPFSDFLRDENVKTTCNVCNAIRQKDIAFKNSDVYKKIIYKNRYKKKKRL